MNLSNEGQKNMHYSSELKFMRKSCLGNHKVINKPMETDEISQQCEKRPFLSRKELRTGLWKISTLRKGRRK